MNKNDTSPIKIERKRLETNEERKQSLKTIWKRGVVDYLATSCDQVIRRHSTTVVWRHTVAVQKQKFFLGTESSRLARKVTKTTAKEGIRNDKNSFKIG